MFYDVIVVDRNDNRASVYEGKNPYTAASACTSAVKVAQEFKTIVRVILADSNLDTLRIWREKDAVNELHAFALAEHAQWCPSATTV
jgi:hypothetical protein